MSRWLADHVTTTDLIAANSPRTLLDDIQNDRGWVRPPPRMAKQNHTRNRFKNRAPKGVVMSALPPKADISGHHSNVRFVP
jgi:hypothetical protein